MDIQSKFIRWYNNSFQEDTLFTAMSYTVENSPWHREGNVGVHTNMVVDEYLSRLTAPWEEKDLICALVVAFHDVGKPDAEEITYSPTRGKYRRYAGHEKISARLWEDYAMRNWSTFVDMGLSVASIYAVGWLIEHHLPYGVEKPLKRQAIFQTAEMLVGFDRFADILRADCWGRISDEHDTKKASVNAWIGTMKSDATRLDWYTDVTNQLESRTSCNNDVPKLVVLIGPSCCGKSTYMREVLNADTTYHHFSWDTLRWLWYSEDYAEAFRLQCEDNNFISKSQKVFMDMIRSKENIAVDNTNLSQKRRAFFINTARQHGYVVSAVLFPMALDELISRAKNRTEQPVPEIAIRRQYMSMGLPSIGEVDKVIVVK